MKKGERGFSTIEMMAVLPVIAIIGLAATMTVFQTINVTDSNNDHLTAVRQVQNAGYWIVHDAQMAESVSTENLSNPNFLFISWTERAYDSGDDVYNTVTYYYDGLTDGIGTLMRNHWSSDGEDADTMVAEYISYDSGDSVNTTNISYRKPVLKVKLTAIYGDDSETREYQINRRQNFN